MLIDLTGRRFGKLRVFSLIESDRKRGVRLLWNCLCDCGKEAIVQGGHLRNGHTISCGCVRSKNSTTHGMAKTATYKTWKGMRQRCLNPNNSSFYYYGGRGIAVCKRWDDFLAFVSDMGEKPRGLTIERKDNERGYEPGNCVWASRKEQAENRRVARASNGTFQRLEAQDFEPCMPVGGGIYGAGLRGGACG